MKKENQEVKKDIQEVKKEEEKKEESGSKNFQDFLASKTHEVEHQIAMKRKTSR